MEIITKREQLVAFKDKYGLRDDWHEPDEQGVDATITGGINTRFDNAFLEPPDPNDRRGLAYGAEHGVILKVDGEPVAYINLALLFSFATGYDGVKVVLGTPAGPGQFR